MAGSMLFAGRGVPKDLWSAELTSFSSSIPNGLENRA